MISVIIDECDIKETEMFYFSVVYPNMEGLTPLDIAIKERASRAVEMMLDMLSQRPHYNFSKYV